MKTKVIFLYHPKKDDVFAFFPFENESADFKLCYSHIGQHSECSPSYALECVLASDEETVKLYKELESIGYELEGAYLDYHREPTKWEISFGEGATHYKGFSPLQYMKPNGDIKKWLKCPIDGLRYYRL